MADLPLISVVTPCLNRAGMVGDAVDSVVAQGYPRFEHVIADGGSTDGTLDVLARYPHLDVVSEPDAGLYDALNKAVARSRGEIIAHLNTDDWYPPGTFHAVAAAFADPTADAVYGGAVVRDDATGRDMARYLDRRRQALRDMAFADGHIITNGWFFRRRVYQQTGGYDPRFRIGGDLDFLIRVAARRPRAVFVPAILYVYRGHGGSLTFSGDPAAGRRIVLDLRAVVEHALRGYRLRAAERRGLVRLLCRLSIYLLIDRAKAGDLAGGVDVVRRGLTSHPLWAIGFGYEGLRLWEAVWARLRRLGGPGSGG